jgi:hypothetical protein
VKILIGDGRRLTAYDARPMYVVTTRPGGPPIKFNGTEVLEDEEARDTLRRIVETRLYRCRALDNSGEGI